MDGTPIPLMGNGRERLDWIMDGRNWKEIGIWEVIEEVRVCTLQPRRGTRSVES